MSDPIVAVELFSALGASEQTFDAYPSREVTLGDLSILRALPVKGRRLVVPWCFLDRFGPLTFQQGTPMDVALMKLAAESSEPNVNSVALLSEPRRFSRELEQRRDRTVVCKNGRPQAPSLRLFPSTYASTRPSPAKGAS